MTEDKARELAKRFGVRMCDENGNTHGEELYCVGLDDIMEMAKALAQPEQEQSGFFGREAMKEHSDFHVAQPEQEHAASLPEEKRTDKWESARVADYNSGWNDCRKTMLASSTKPVLEIVNGQINRSWDAIPDNFTGMLYTTSPQRKPLTIEQRNEIARQADENDWHDYDIIDAVEAAHGIKE